MRIFLLFILISFQQLAFAQKSAYNLRGVISSENELLVGATILIHELKLGVVSNEKGEFKIWNLKPGAYHMHVTFVGYESFYMEFTVKNEDLVINVEMKPSSIELREVTVEANPFKSGSVEQSQTIKVVDKSYLDKNVANSFVNAIEKIPGVNSISTGVGIAKPVIRGMSFNRVMVNDHGIKQEGQQWGADHGLEIDMFDVERVEIIKGPASLMYGSDGMGGVININSVSFPQLNTFSTGVKSVYKTNNNLRAHTAYLQSNKSGFIFKARISMQDFDNYQVPATSFTYGGFVLPIFDNILRNTAGEERNFSVMTGVNRNWGFSTVTVSRFKQKVGLFPGAIGRPTAFVLNRYDPISSIDLPRQNNEHWKVLSNTNILINKNWLEVDLGYQYNKRREESLPHAHNVAEGQDQNLALGLDLQTFTANARYHTRINGKWKGIHGFQLQHTNNQYSGFEFLLPEFYTNMAGAFSFFEFKPFDDLVLNTGIRYDVGNHDIRKHEQPIYQNLQPTGEMDVRNEDINRSFKNFSGSVGASWIPAEHYNVKLNVGSSFRMPTANELSSNGIHHGTFRHELGNQNLNSERGYQVDLNLTYSSQKYFIAITPYYAFYDNYLYLGPTPFFSQLPSGNQLTWEFRQSRARFYGGEFEMEYHFLKGLHAGVSAEYVRSYNLDSQLPLPLTPPPSVMADVEYSFSPAPKWIDNVFFSYYVKSFTAQNRVDRNERTTPAYTIMGTSLGIDFLFIKQPLNLMLQVDNLTNEAYFNHLSRYRLLNLPEQGRNFIISLGIPINGNFR